MFTVVSRDLVRWKRLPSPVRPGAAWYDSTGSFDGSAAILPGLGPVILVDNIGPFTPPPAAVSTSQRRQLLRDNPGCQGLSWPVDLDDAELTHWRKDSLNPLNVTNLPCGSRVKNSAGAFPGGIFQNGDHWNYLSFGYRFTSTDPKLHTWRQVEKPFLTGAFCDQSKNHSCPPHSFTDDGGQWTLRVPATIVSTQAIIHGSIKRRNGLDRLSAGMFFERSLVITERYATTAGRADAHGLLRPRKQILPRLLPHGE